MQRKIAVTLLIGAGFGASGCQSPALSRLAIWNRNNAVAGSTAPDVGRQKFLGLSQQLASDQPRPMGQAKAGTAPLGGARPADNDGFIVASWKKTTAAITGATAAKKATAPEDDPLRLDKMPKKIGPEVYVGAARLLENQGNFADAEAKYNEALRAAPSDLNALVGLARLHDRQSASQKALDFYQKAAQAHPNNGLVFNDMGLCYRRQNQLDKSLNAFRKAVDLQPENAKYRNNLAAALVDAGRADEAFKEIAAVNSPAVAHYNLAFMLEQRGLRAEATQHLQEALRLDPALTPAHNMLAQLTNNSIPSTAAATNQPAPRMAQPKENLNTPYSTGSAEQNIYTSAPQIDGPAAALPPTYHLGDDAGPAAETAQRTNWGGAAWALPPTESASSAHPLPPVDDETTTP